jgi:hypothetical protein
MRANLPFLLIAVALLWFPRQWMRQGLAFWTRRKRRSAGLVRREQEPWNTSEPGDPAVRFGAEFRKLRNYMDALRAAAGFTAIMGGFGLDASLTAAPGATALVNMEVQAAKLAILLIGLLVQTVRYERNRLLFFAPIFFLFGLSFGLCGAKGAAFGFAMVWAVNPSLKNPQAFLSVYALLVGIFGLFFLGFGNKLPLAALGFCFLPVLLSLLAQRPLVLFARRGTRSSGASS